jgi:hypothetical protein
VPRERSGEHTPPPLFGIPSEEREPSTIWHSERGARATHYPAFRARSDEPPYSAFRVSSESQPPPLFRPPVPPVSVKDGYAGHSVQSSESHPPPLFVSTPNPTSFGEGRVRRSITTSFLCLHSAANGRRATNTFSLYFPSLSAQRASPARFHFLFISCPFPLSLSFSRRARRAARYLQLQEQQNSDSRAKSSCKSSER